MSFPNVPAGYPPGWNDPPPLAFGSNGASSQQRKSDKGGAGAVETAHTPASPDPSLVISKLREILQKSRAEIIIHNTKITDNHRKMMEDAEKRIEPFLQGSAELYSLSPVALANLDQFVNALSSDEYQLATKIHAQLMKDTFSNNSAGSQWVLGLKRLLDVRKALVM